SYRDVLALDGGNFDALHLSGVLLHQRGRHDDAIDLIRRALAQKPDSADAHCNLGMVYRTAGRIDDAIAACRRALAINPALATAHNNLGIALADLRRHEG